MAQNWWSYYCAGDGGVDVCGGGFTCRERVRDGWVCGTSLGGRCFG